MPAQKPTAARLLDQFYTSNKFATRYVKRLGRRYDLTSSLLVEPSAGGGAFYKRLPVNKVAFDVDPKYPGILTADFLAFELRSEYHTIIVGNPHSGETPVWPSHSSTMPPAMRTSSR